MRISKKHDGGFTLIEMIFVLIIASFMTVAVISAYLNTQESLRSINTKEKMEIIMDAMAAFAARNYRIPCPADPTGAGPEPAGAERGSGANGANIPAGCNGTDAEGIVPYRTIGLSEADVRDGWDRLITYEVSPAFTRDPEDPDTSVHYACRTREWIEGVNYREEGAGFDLLNPNDDTTNVSWFENKVTVSPTEERLYGRNVNPQKARFCCTGEDRGEDIRICLNDACTNIIPQFGRTSIFTISNLLRTRFREAYQEADILADHFKNHDEDGELPDLVTFLDELTMRVPLDIATPAAAEPYYSIEAQYVPEFRNTTGVAYVLISHGNNGVGAFTGDASASARFDGPAGTREQDNGNVANKNVYALEKDDTAGNNFYDDIVRWQTQDQVLARLKRDSCAVP